MAWLSLTYENPRGFSTRFLFAKLGTKPRNKPYTTTLAFVFTFIKTHPSKNSN